MKNLNLEEKDIYKLFNEIKINEVNLYENNKEEVSELQKKRIKKNLMKTLKEKRNFKGLKYGTMAAGLSIICLVGTAFKYPAFAENIPGLNSIMEVLNSSHGNHTKYSDYSTLINKTVTSNDVTFTINEALADDSKIILSYTIKSSKKINDLEVFGLNHFLKINGKSFGSGGSMVGKYVDDTTYIGSAEIESDAIKEAKDLNIDLNIEKIGDIKGNWDFTFSLSKNEALKNKMVVEPNVKINHKDRVTTIDKVTISPLETSISISEVLNKDVDPNNPLLPYASFIVFDDRGVELGWKGGNSKQNSSKLIGEDSYSNLNYKPKYLTIIPYMTTPQKVGSANSDGKETVTKGIVPKEVSKDINGSCPMELSQGKVGKLIITEVIKETNKTIVKYKAEGIAPLLQGQNFHIKDSEGNYVKILDYDIRKDESNPNEFTKTFEALEPNKKYTLSTDTFDNVDIREDLKFTIELNK